MKYYDKTYAGYVLSDEMERHIDKEKPRMGWYRQDRYNAAYNNSNQLLIKHRKAFVFFYAMLSILYILFSIYDYFTEGYGFVQFILFLLLGVGWGIFAITLYFYDEINTRWPQLNKTITKI